MSPNIQKMPLLPRRSFLAAGLSAVLAGSAAYLAIAGGVTAVQRATFQFSRGVSLAKGDREALRGFLARALPDERMHVTILAHTGSTGDSHANIKLSQERAAFVEALAKDLGIAQERITARGLGGSAPLGKDPGESERAFQSRLARVEVALQLRR